MLEDKGSQDSTTAPVAVAEEAIGTSQARGIFWSVVIVCALAVFSLPVFGYLVNKYHAWQTYIMLVGDVLMGLGGLLGLRLVRRNRPIQGVEAIIGGAAIMVLCIAAFSVGTGLVIGIGLVVGVVVMATQTMPPRLARRAILAGISIGIVAGLLDYIGLPTQRSIPEFNWYVPVAVGVVGVVFLILLAFQFRTFSLSGKLIVAFLAVTLPLLAAMGIILTQRTQRDLEQDANRSLSALNQAIYNSTNIWLDYNLKALENLIVNPDIVSMDASRQKVLLQQLAAAYPQMYLVSTTDLNGMNVARNDDAKLTDYKDRVWFQNAKAGAPVTFQTLIGRTTGQPAVVVSMPIRDQSSKIVGVGMFASDLDEVSALVRDVTLAGSIVGQNALATVYIIDQNNQLVAHPDPAQTSELKDVSSWPPVSHLRQGEIGGMIYTDENGEAWRAEVRLLPNGWGIIAQARQADLLAPTRDFQRLSLLILVIGTVLLLTYVWVTVRRSLHPIQTLTETARAVTAGDLTRLSPIQSQDELGVLAKAMNAMTTQLAELIGSLERRVTERTRAIEVSAEVSRRLSTILDVQELLKAVVEEVQESFGYYQAQIYLWDTSEENLVLAYGTGEAGRTLMQSGHKITPGRGLVGRAGAYNQSVLVTDTRTDPEWLPNPLLPETRAEAAIPIAISGEVLGVLDVQQNKAGGLTEQDVSLLQSVANQVAIALQNARQVEQTQKVLTELGQSENRFRSVYDGSNDAIMLLDDNGFFDCNEQALQLFGFERKEDFLKAMPAEISPPLQPDGRDSEEAANENMQMAYEKGFNRFEWVHRRTNGEDFPAEVLLSAFSLSGKQVLQATVRDFTERQYAQVELRRQAEELSKVAAIATTVSTILEPETLLEQVSDLTKTAFNLYHAHIYLMNADGDMLELAAGAGEVGREMVAQGRLIPLDSERSLVARAARQRQGVIVNDVQAEPDFLSNPLLPETASEMAVPLIVGDQCLGVMDVQSERVNRFSPTDVAIQTTLASQVAVALQNARQYEQARQSEQLVRTLIDNLPDCIFVKDSKSRWILNNKAHLAMLGFETQEQVLGKSDLDIFPIELAQKYYDDEQELLRRKEPLINYQESVIHQTTGQRLSILTSKIPILDEHGNITALVGINHDITEREQLERETQERLAEIDSLYRAMSRQAWDTFQRTTKSQTSFYYDRSQPTTAAPAPDQWLEVTKQAIDRKESPQTPVSGQPVWAAPLLLRGDPIGAMAVEVDEQHPLTDEEKDLLAEMSDQIALAVESARLFEQTRTTLAETEMLYGIIAEMNAAQGYDDILKAMSERTSLRRADLLLLGIFDQPLRGEEQLPEWIYPVAVRGAEKVEIAQKYPVGAFQAIPNTLFTDQPVMVSDVGGDRRLDSVARTLFKEVFHASGMLILPLRLADQSIGFVMGFFCETSQIAPEDLQPLLAVTGQAAIAVQSRLLLERSQAHARQEQRIREVSAQVFGAADVDTIMRRAVQQIGRVLGMPAYIYLGQAPDSSTTE